MSVHTNVALIANKVRELDALARKLRKQYENDCNYPSPKTKRIDAYGEPMTRRDCRIERLQKAADAVWATLDKELELHGALTLRHQTDPRGAALHVGAAGSPHGNAAAYFG